MSPRPLADWPTLIEEALADRRRHGRLRQLPGPGLPGRIDVSSNDFWGLAAAPPNEAERAALEACLEAGASGAGASRLVYGDHEWVRALEEDAARFWEAGRALFFPTGYLANLAVVGALAPLAGRVIADERCHASMLEGLRARGGGRSFFAHGDLEDLERRLAAAEGPALVLAESLYSMTGHQPDLERLHDICTRYGALLVLDEAHASGLYGPAGQGRAFVLPPTSAAPGGLIRILTLGKAFGLQGGIVLCNGPMGDLLVNLARPLIYSTGPLPLHCALARARLTRLFGTDDLRQGPALQDAYRALSESVGNMIAAAPPLPDGLWWQHDRRKGLLTPILSLRGPGEALTALAARLEDAGYQVKVILTPTVPPGQECLRLTLRLPAGAEAYNRLIEGLSIKK